MHSCTVHSYVRLFRKAGHSYCIERWDAIEIGDNEEALNMLMYIQQRKHFLLTVCNVVLDIIIIAIVANQYELIN